MHACIFVTNYRSFMMLYAFQICPYVARSNEISVKIDSDVDNNVNPISACLSNSIHKPIDATNINQADDNEPFNECKMDD